MRAFLRRIAPQFLLDWYRKRAKKKVNENLQKKKEAGNVVTEDLLIEDLKKAGIRVGDSLLVHASMSKLGFVEGGPNTVISALKKVVGSNGNILMPTSPNAGLQLDYIRGLEVFDVENDVSKLGVISETFRKMDGVVRSAHPTEPVSCLGPDSDFYTKDHFGQETPYTDKSPFYKISNNGGKILYLGVTLDNAGTNLHTLEDAIDEFKFPVYFEESFEVLVRLKTGELKKMTTKVHNPIQSDKRKCDDLIPLFERKGVLNKVKIANADALIVDARVMLEVMIDEYNENGVTMYTPEGS